MTSKSYTFIQSAGEHFALLCQAQAFPVPLIRYYIFCRHRTLLSQQFTLFVNIYAILILNIPFYFIFVEPVGAKGPTFATDSNSFSYTRLIGQSFGLLCQAQAYPVPLIR